MNRTYMCIDLKSFYASVECVERNLDPLNTNLVVADSDRTDKTVCLAVTPSLKQYGLGGRARLYEVRQKINQINIERRKNNNYKKFIGKSYLDSELKTNKNLELDLIIAKPRMKHYMKYSSKIYEIYLKYVSKDDIFVYSIDEVFIDITDYLKMYNKTPNQLITEMITEVYKQTGITATGGIGTNLFLAKVAMDVVAKHEDANEFGVRIASLDENLFKHKMWDHKPLTDIWRIGKGISNKLEQYGMYTLGDVALMSIKNEDLLYKLFGINAELIIDHAWGYEPCTMKDIKQYKPLTKSLGSGQVLHEPYTNKQCIIIIKEMCDNLALDLISKGFVTKQLVLTISYDVINLKDSYISKKYKGDIVTDSYGRKIPKHDHGTVNLDYYSASSTIIIENVLKLYNKISNPLLYIRKISISANDIKKENDVDKETRNTQLDLFNTVSLSDDKKIEKKDREIEKIMLNIKNKYGKNSIVKGMNLEEYATGIERNKEVGGHHE